MSYPEIAIIVVLYNAKDFSERLIRSLDWIESDPRYSLYVQDNSPAPVFDQSMQELPWINYEFTGENIGFGSGVNRALSRVPDIDQIRYTLLLNPDLEIDRVTIDGMVEASDSDKDIAILGPQILLSDGEIEQSYFNKRSVMSFIMSLLTGVGQKADMSITDSKTVYSLSGACMLISNEFIRRHIIELKLFNPAFFMYFEDMDLCHRVYMSEMKCVYDPQFQVRHHLNRSSKRKGQRYWLREQYIVSSLKFYRLNYNYFSFIMLKIYWLKITILKYLIGLGGGKSLHFIKSILQTK